MLTDSMQSKLCVSKDQNFYVKENAERCASELQEEKDWRERLMHFQHCSLDEELKALYEDTEAKKCRMIAAEEKQQVDYCIPVHLILRTYSNALVSHFVENFAFSSRPENENAVKTLQYLEQLTWQQWDSEIPLDNKRESFRYHIVAKEESTRRTRRFHLTYVMNAFPLLEEWYQIQHRYDLCAGNIYSEDDVRLQSEFIYLLQKYVPSSVQMRIQRALGVESLQWSCASQRAEKLELHSNQQFTLLIIAYLTRHATTCSSYLLYAEDTIKIAASYMVKVYFELEAPSLPKLIQGQTLWDADSYQAASCSLEVKSICVQDEGEVHHFTKATYKSQPIPDLLYALVDSCFNGNRIIRFNFDSENGYLCIEVSKDLSRNHYVASHSHRLSVLTQHSFAEILSQYCHTGPVTYTAPPFPLKFTDIVNYYNSVLQRRMKAGVFYIQGECNNAVVQYFHNNLFRKLNDDLIAVPRLQKVLDKYLDRYSGPDCLTALDLPHEESYTQAAITYGRYPFNLNYVHKDRELVQKESLIANYRLHKFLLQPLFSHLLHCVIDSPRITKRTLRPVLPIALIQIILSFI
jgi:hypothetical protein